MSDQVKAVQDGGMCPYCGRVPNQCDTLREQVKELTRVVESLAATVRMLNSRTLGSVKLG